MNEHLLRSRSRREFLRLAGKTAATVGFCLALPSLWRGTVQAQGFFFPTSRLASLEEMSDRLVPALSRCPSAIRLLLQEFRLVDARSRPAFLEGHALSAAQLEGESLSAERGGVPGLLAPIDEIAERLGGIGIDAELETILYSDNGNLWATRLFWILDYLGHTNVRILDGGSARWQRDPSMVEVGEPAVEPRVRTFNPTALPDKIVDAAWIQARLGDPDVVFVDARAAEAFERGHLPGAVNLPWRDNISWPDETFVPIGSLAARFADANVTSEKTVISYCQLGVLSAHNYFALRLLGYPDVRLYDGSWADWTTDSERPVEAGS